MGERSRLPRRRSASTWEFRSVGYRLGAVWCGGRPFHVRDGHRYLEVHHVVTLADRGPDTTESAVAVCPNCHRRLRLGADAADQAGGGSGCVGNGSGADART